MSNLSHSFSALAAKAFTDEKYARSTDQTSTFVCYVADRIFAAAASPFGEVTNSENHASWVEGSELERGFVLQRDVSQRSRRANEELLTPNPPLDPVKTTTLRFSGVVVVGSFH